MSATLTRPPKARKAPIHVVTPEADFIAGRDLAIALLTEAAPLTHTDRAAAVRWHREGRPQLRFVAKYLEQLRAQPELVDGFDAVLSPALATAMEVQRPQDYLLPRAEFEAGLPGEHGTRTDETANAAYQPRTLAPGDFDGNAPTSEQFLRAGRECALVAQAEALAQLVAENMADDLAWAGHTLLEQAFHSINKATEAQDMASVHTGMGVLAQAHATLRALYDEHDGVGISGVMTLIERAQEEIYACFT